MRHDHRAQAALGSSLLPLSADFLPIPAPQASTSPQTLPGTVTRPIRPIRPIHPPSHPPRPRLERLIINTQEGKTRDHYLDIALTPHLHHPGIA